MIHFISSEIFFCAEKLRTMHIGALKNSSIYPRENVSILSVMRENVKIESQERLTQSLYTHAHLTSRRRHSPTNRTIPFFFVLLLLPPSIRRCMIASPFLAPLLPSSSFEWSTINLRRLLPFDGLTQGNGIE